jgi:hypothetical protein
MGRWTKAAGHHLLCRLSVLITTQMAQDPAATGRIRQQDSGNKVLASEGNGIFRAGETRDVTLTGINSNSELSMAAGCGFLCRRFIRPAG